MKIDGPNPLRGGAVRKAKARKPAGGGAFSDALGEPEEAVVAAPGVTATGPVHSVDSLLALQATDDVGDRRGRARARGEALLDRLDMLRTDMLLGRIPRHRLEELSALARSSRAVADDPRLEEVLDEIDLRAQVELAKLAADP